MPRGYIRKRGNSYQLAVSLGKDPKSGKKLYHWETFHGDSKQAKKRLTEILHQVDAGTYIKPQTKLTTGEFLTRWLEDYAKSHLSARSFERYRDIIRQHFIPAFGKIPLHQLRLYDLQKHYSSLLKNNFSPQTVRFHHSVIHKALDTALRWEMVSRNVADSAELPPRSKADFNTWTAGQVQKFIDKAKSNWYYVLFYVALTTGMRRSELLGLKWQDVDLDLCTVSINKGLHKLKTGEYVFSEPKSEKSRRLIDLPPSTTLLLKQYYQKRAADYALLGEELTQNTLVFTREDGSPLRPNTVTSAFHALLIKYGLPNIKLRETRHTHATLLLAQGVHLKVVQERLGHSSIAITADIYSHVAPGIQKKAAEDFDRIIQQD